MLTIGQLAGFAGVTVRAVRHYHARGLLPEAERDPSGYRRYDAQAVVTLIRIRTLAEAGVPLARVSELLQAEPAEFGQALVEIDRDLAARIAVLRQRRRQVAGLASGAGIALPDYVLDYLERLRDIGVRQRVIDIEHDGWIMLAAYAPDRIAAWIKLKNDALDDEEYRDMYLRLDEAIDWQPDDPRLHTLADAMVAYARRWPAVDDPQMPRATEFDDTMIGLLDAHATQASPVLTRLQQLMEQRGLDGWNDVREADPG